MKDVSSVALLLLVASVACQGPLYGFNPVPGAIGGAQPTMYGPNYPQVQGVNVQGFGFNQPMGGLPRTGADWAISAANPAVQNRLANTPSTAGPIFPQCSTLDSIGSPVLLVYQAAEFIDKLMDPKNANSFVNYIYFNMVQDTTNPLFMIYTLVYALSDFSGTTYIGVRFKTATPKVTESHFTHSGTGDADFITFILNKDIAVVNAALEIPGSAVPPNINCGDLKFAYSSYGNSPGSAVPGPYPGQNQNGSIAALIQQFKARQASYDRKTNDIYDEIYKARKPFSADQPLPYTLTGWQIYEQLIRSETNNN